MFNNIIVTGGAGFIGSNLTLKLQEQRPIGIHHKHGNRLARDFAHLNCTATRASVEATE